MPVKAPKAQKPIGLKWVFKIKKNPFGEVVKHTKLVVKGYCQRYKFDYDKLFDHFESILILIALAAQEY